MKFLSMWWCATRDEPITEFGSSLERKRQIFCVTAQAKSRVIASALTSSRGWFK